MIKTVLLPIDAADRTNSILPHVTEIAKRFGARVVLLHALQPFSPLAPRMPLMIETPLDTAAIQVAAEESAEILQKAAHELLAGIAADLDKNGIESISLVKDGDPATIITDVAKEHEADLIAMSTHGRSGIGRFLLGSVADEVVRGTTIPVLLIRTPERHD